MAINLTLFRAVSRYYLSRITRIATYIALSLGAVGLLITWLLVHYFSNWWWLLAIPILILLIAFLVLRLIVIAIARVIYPETVSPETADQIKAFIEKVNRLLEIKNINPSLIALTSIKDFALYRELRTLKGLISDSQTLRSDFQKLNDQF